jgi:hypothetical protein
MSTFFLPRE